MFKVDEGSSILSMMNFNLVNNLLRNLVLLLASWMECCIFGHQLLWQSSNAVVREKVLYPLPTLA